LPCRHRFIKPRMFFWGHPVIGYLVAFASVGAATAL
jgi:hypothetical protein